jgi:hypothetical protein
MRHDPFVDVERRPALEDRSERRAHAPLESVITTQVAFGEKVLFAVIGDLA